MTNIKNCFEQWQITAQFSKYN